jgi:hypothetical protein
MALPTTTTTRLGSPGDIVVPFSEIAALLQSRLSGLELNNLLTQLLGSRTTLVQPGDLITADWAMDVINRIAALERGDVGAIGNPLSASAVETLFETYDAYSRLSTRGSFLPDGTGADAFSAALGMTTAIQNVLILAAASTGPAEASSVDGLVEIFSRLYTAQKNLTVLFLTSIPGVSNPQPRMLFAQRVAAVLDSDESSGALSLKSAIAQNKADAAILAQDRVNGVVMSEAGDSVIGSIGVQSRGTTRGDTLVIGDAQPFGFIFRVTNLTNRPLTIQLTSGFPAPRESWSGSTAIVGGAGQLLNLRPFDSANPNNPAAFQDITVNVVTPAGASSGDTGALQLRAFVPAPINIAGVDSAPVKVGTVQSNPQASNIRFDAGTPVTTSGNPSGVNSSSSAEMRFDFGFTTSSGPTTRSFRLRIDTTDTAAAMQKFFAAIEDADVPVDNGASTPTKVQSQQFSLSDGQRRSLTLLFGTLTAVAGDQLHLTVTVEAVDDGTISDSRSFTITAN